MSPAAACKRIHPQCVWSSVSPPPVSGTADGLTLEQRHIPPPHTPWTRSSHPTVAPLHSNPPRLIVTDTKRTFLCFFGHFPGGAAEDVCAGQSHEPLAAAGSPWTLVSVCRCVCVWRSRGVSIMVRGEEGALSGKWCRCSSSSSVSLRVAASGTCDHIQRVIVSSAGPEREEQV